MTTIFDRRILSCMLIAACACTGAGIAGLHFNVFPTAKWLNTASGFFALSAVFQARSSGWFSSVLEFYGNDEKFPSGPPSHITREIIDNPDRPLRTWARNILFFETQTALVLGIISIIVAMIATWL